MCSRGSLSSDVSEIKLVFSIPPGRPAPEIAPSLKGDQFKLREIQLGKHIAHNVVASIGPVKGDLLLGQTFLSRFGIWAIDNTRHVLILGSPDEAQQNLRGAQRVGH
jgi:hypothetical protein